MNFKKQTSTTMKVFDRLYISDLHYPIRGTMVDNSHRQLFEMLGLFRGRNYLFREIYLVGDIFENWYISSESHIKKNKEDYEVLFRSLESILVANGKKYYIVGNHDSRSLLLKLPPLVEKFVKERGWQVQEVVEDEQVIVAHGHQGEYSRFVWVFNILFVRLFYFLGMFVPGLFSAVHSWHDNLTNFRSGDTRQDELRFYANLSRRLNQKNKTLVVGHTHHFVGFPNLNIANTGDWMNSRSLIIQNDGVLHGYTFEEGFLKERYKVELPKIKKQRATKKQKSSVHFHQPAKEKTGSY